LCFTRARQYQIGSSGARTLTSSPLTDPTQLRELCSRISVAAPITPKLDFRHAQAGCDRELPATAGISSTREPAVTGYDRLPPGTACVVRVWRGRFPIRQRIYGEAAKTHSRRSSVALRNVGVKARGEVGQTDAAA
jgi:hypothetical protein